ncbi:MAG: hypothetical protein CM15mV118_460 [uncultured marine virus]|nr:MAG: hypothetical protein CM15mV118_460 [uncultured marine virus]
MDVPTLTFIVELKYVSLLEASITVDAKSSENLSLILRSWLAVIGATIEAIRPSR